MEGVAIPTSWIEANASAALAAAGGDCEAAATATAANGRPVKASYEVKEGDVLEIGFGNRAVKVRVLSVQETVRKEEADGMFEYL